MMPDTRQFETGGLTWGQRARHGELNAGIKPHRPERFNLLVHSICLFAARVALAWGGRTGRRRGVLLDFGCRTGRVLRFFRACGYSLIGTEITPEMLSEAKRYGLPHGAEVHLTDGVSIPLPDQSVDMVWVCGVLKYSLFAPGSVCRGGSGTLSRERFVPVYLDIAHEMY